ncbi:hypothetical protein [Alicyclobacillus sp. SP_1]|nr:hypothetical protein [Alicyclobacillus sp. SP_1]
MPTTVYRVTLQSVVYNVAIVGVVTAIIGILLVANPLMLIIKWLIGLYGG